MELNGKQIYERCKDEYRIISTTKNSYLRICRFMVKKSLKLRLVVKKWSGQMIDKMNSSEECMVQKIEKNVGLI